MKQVFFAFLAQNVELLADGQVTISRPDIDGLTALQVPFDASLFFVAKLIFAADETSRPHTVFIEYTKPDGVRLPIGGQMPLLVQTNPQNPSADAKSMVIAAMGVKFESIGVYVFRMMVDEEEIATRDLNITRLPQDTASLLTTAAQK